MEDLRLLRTEFKKRGVTYTQVEKNNKYVIYQCVDQHGNRYVEIFRYRINLADPKWGADYNGTESYPRDESFGVWAWCCSSKAQLKNCLSLNFEISGEEADGIVEKSFAA